jgi:hypothetical protein
MSAPLPPPTPYPPPSAVVRARNLVTRILWTALPIGTLGLCGWVPALHIARRRRTPASWWWLAALAAATVGECVLVWLVPSQEHGSKETAAGTFTVTYLITATVYAWRGNGADLPVLRPAPYPGYGAWMPVGYGSAPPAPQASMPQPYPAAPGTPAGSAVFAAPTAPAAPAAPIPPSSAAAASDMAAEVQAELRELRGFLGGEDAR